MSGLRRDEISIADIARIAGVSHTTVSRALRQSPSISVGTRERIQRLASEMGYTPNAIAQSLQTRRTSTIGLVITSIADPFLSDVVKGIEEVARDAGFSVLLSASHNNPEQEMAIIETFHRRRVDGILATASRISSEYNKRLNRIRVPTVLINGLRSNDRGQRMSPFNISRIMLLPCAGSPADRPPASTPRPAAQPDPRAPRATFAPGRTGRRACR